MAVRTQGRSVALQSVSLAKGVIGKADEASRLRNFPFSISTIQAAPERANPIGPMSRREQDPLF